MHAQTQATHLDFVVVPENVGELAHVAAYSFLHVSRLVGWSDWLVGRSAEYGFRINLNYSTLQQTFYAASKKQNSKPF